MDSIHSFADRPHPILIDDKKPAQLQSAKTEKSIKPINKRTTKKKEFIRGNTGTKFATPSREDDD